MTREEQLLIAQDLADRFADYMVKINATLPQPKAVISLETAIAFALVYADEFATGQAAAMRERAAGVATAAAEAARPYANGVGLGPATERHRMLEAERIAAAIRALPATGEVGR